MEHNYCVEIQIEWSNPEDNSGQNEVISFCQYLSDAEAVYDYRVKRAEEELARFKEHGGYKTVYVGLKEIGEKSNHLICKKFFF